MESLHEREKFDLVGVDGNAFNVMAYVKTAMHEAGFSKEESLRMWKIV